MLDLSVGFDTVDHDILLKRLDSRFSICRTARDWFRSYLTNSTQFALIDGWKKHNIASSNVACLRARVLGPILYLL